MARRRTVMILLMVCFVFSAALPAGAAEDVLQLVPASASGVIVINNLAALDAKLQELGRMMELPALSLRDMLQQKIPFREGLDEQGTFALIVLPPEDHSPMPAPVLLAPVSDYDKFLRQFSLKAEEGPLSEIEIFHSPTWIRKIGGYAAMTDAAHRDVLEKVLKLSSETPAALAPWRPWLADKDVAGVILKPGIDRLAARVQKGIEQFKAMTAASPQAKNLAGIFDVYAELFQSAKKELTSVGIGAQLDRQNVLRITKRALLVPGGKWASSLKGIHPPKENLLTGFPPQRFVLAAGSVVTRPMMKGLMKFSFQMMKTMPQVYGLNDEQIGKLSELSTSYLQGVKDFSMVLGVGENEKSIYSGMVNQFQVDDARAFLKGYEKYVDQYNEIVKNAEGSLLPSMALEKAEIDGHPALKLTWNVPQPPEETPQSAQMLKALMGPEGKIVAWLVGANDHCVVMGYENQDLLRKMLAEIKQGKSGLAGDDALKRTAALLPANAFAVSYLSPAGTVELVRRILPAMLPPQLSRGLHIPKFPKTPPLGLAVSAASNEMESCLVVPAEVFQALGHYVNEVLANKSKTPEAID